MTNYVEIKKFDQQEFESRCSQVESTYSNYAPDATQPTTANPYLLYASDLLPEDVDYRALPGAMEYFITYDGLAKAFDTYTQALKDGFVGCIAAGVTGRTDVVPVVNWWMEKPIKAQKPEIASLHKLVKARYLSDLRHWNEQETARLIELRLIEKEREKEQEEQARLAAIREQALAELMETYK